MIRLTYPDGLSIPLRWTDQSSASSYGLGVLMRRRSSQVIDGAYFAELVRREGARIVCSDDLEARRCAGALGFAALGLPESVIAVERE